MREIKFRSWSEKDKRFYYFYNGGYFMECGTIAKQFRFDWDNAEQYTGLKDKNGVEIYEGDICQIEGSFSDMILIIEFIDGAFCLTHKNNIRPTDDSVTIRDAIFEAKKHKVDFIIEKIGNIHENPKLMEV